MESSENTNMQRTYTAEQIAQILGISVRKAYDFCATTKEFKVILKNGWKASMTRSDPSPEKEDQDGIIQGQRRII